MGMAMFGERLLRARKAAGLSLRDLAAEVNLSHAAIKKYEDGAAMPSSDVLLRLAKALGVRSEYFFRPLTPELEFVEFRKRSSLPKKREAIAPTGFTRRHGNSIAARISVVQRDGLDRCLR